MFSTTEGSNQLSAIDVRGLFSDSLRASFAYLDDLLEQNRQERELLLALKKQGEDWLRLHPRILAPPQQMPLILSPKKPTPKAERSDGQLPISMRSTVLNVLKDAQGEALSAREIYRRAVERGATSNAKDAEGTTDFVCYGLKTRSHQPIEKVASRTWRWVRSGAES